MNKDNIKVNVRGTLRAMEVGECNAIVLTGVRGTTLRQQACTLKDWGMVFHVSKVEGGYKVWREE